ncbi:MAG: 3-phenylpropionate/cinnamic acid dioxygenase subunit beta [Alphaproteobacteria bacterium]|nr:3-phenylpropionate/cinnamic acid dioxygenase subunit beta [Alphaproteobacteria bacterium]
MPTDAALQALLLHHEIEGFLLAEADLLDDRKYRDWLNLFTDDLVYWMPISRNVPPPDRDRARSDESLDASWFNEGLDTLTQRVNQIETDIHWSEEPPTRTTHMVSNVRILDVGDGDEIRTKCRFLVYCNRLQDEVDLFVGKRFDTLRRASGGWKISRREIHLDQSVLLAKSLTTFF